MREISGAARTSLHSLCTFRSVSVTVISSSSKSSIKSSKRLPLALCSSKAWVGRKEGVEHCLGLEARGEVSALHTRDRHSGSCPGGDLHWRPSGDSSLPEQNCKGDLDDLLTTCGLCDLQIIGAAKLALKDAA